MSLSYHPDWLQPSWKGPRVKFTLPPASFFEFPPSPEPAVLPPPPDNPTLAHPFTIPPELYNAVFSPHVPITIALVYATTITYFNSVNARRKNKPWAISQTWLFTIGVLLHNLALAAYSAWTCIGMVNDLLIVFEHSYGPHGLAATVDSLCKLHGPRGLGSAAVHSSKTSQWSISNKAYHLSSTFLPESSDVGRIWNEGLAFYGWLFYLSKFYEIVDTLIIIAKGKKSSFLQTYHHAGAMMCMWAGIRYMSPPIWMFVMVNSFIHTVMYTFYFFTALRIRVPKPLKQILTTMQITQFIMGASYAFLHFFVKYQIPVSTPYVYHLGKKIVEGASSLGADAASEFTSAMAAVTASADSQAWLKKLAFRAAGREGLAQNVLNSQGQTFGVDAVHAVQDFVQREEVQYRDELTWVDCLDTSGQAFAIYLNLVYLLPLTWLFVQFFINSYLRRSEVQKRRSLSERVSLAGQSFDDARKGVGRRLSEAFENSQGWNGDANGDEVVIDGEKVRQQLRELDEKMRKKADEVAVETPGSDDIKKTVKDGAEKAKAKATDAAASTKRAVQDVKNQASKSGGMGVEDVLEKAQETVTSKGKSTIQSTSSEVSSTTVFESSSISKSSQDEVISTSNLVRDSDVDTKTGTKKEASTSNVVPSEPTSKRDVSDSRAVEESSIDTRPSTPRSSQNQISTDSSSPNKGPEDQTTEPDKTQPSSTINTRQSPSTPSDSSDDDSSSEEEEEEVFDAFSQTRPTSSASQSPSKPTPTPSLNWNHTFPPHSSRQDRNQNQATNTGRVRDRSSSPTKIPAPQHVMNSALQGGAQTRKWHARRRGLVDNVDGVDPLENSAVLRRVGLETGTLTRDVHSTPAAG